MNYIEILNIHKELFNSNVTKEYSYRIMALKKLKTAIIKYEDEIKQALYLDLGKSYEESYMTEIGVVLSELSYMIKKLKGWMKIKKVKTPLSLFPAKSYIKYVPYGTVLVLAPWNYPFQLALNPLIGALSAGNTAIVKPSPNAVNTANVIKMILNDVFSPNYVTVIIGSDQEADMLLSLPFDYIFFTGSIRIGKHVMQKASENLIPITLELGGKSPVILGDVNDFDLAVKRIVFGKLINAGQTCIAPDYVMIKQDKVKEFIEKFNFYVNTFYGDNPLSNDKYPKIVNKKHLERLKGYMKEGTILVGGNISEDKIEPTVISNIDESSKIMQEEIFGPILPIVTYDNLTDSINKFNTLPKPLVIYAFTNNIKERTTISKSVLSGALVFNDTLMHFANHNLPFGGVGASGMGNYHGIHSFKTFSHEMAILDRGKIDLSFRYQPLNNKKEKTIKRFLK